MSPRALGLALVLLVARLPPPAWAAATLPPTSRFEENRGQFPPAVRFAARHRGWHAFVTTTELVLDLGAGRQPLRLTLLGANPHAQSGGSRHLPGVINDYRGCDPTRWRAGVPTFAAVEIHDAYPGIDVQVRGTGDGIEYDFVVLPGADPGRIDLAIHGGCPLEHLPDGALLIHASGVDLRHNKPYAYQRLDGGETREVDARYSLHGGNRVRIELGPYDRGRPLVIDPVLSFATYLGGSGTDEVDGVAVDADGNILVVGTTESPDFPVANATLPPGGLQDAFVTKIDPSGTTLVYSTYIGGSLFESGRAIAVDPAGNAYIAGGTNSADFPILDAFQPTFGGYNDAFVAELDPVGALLYSTYLGGSIAGNGSTATDSLALAIAVDAGGSAHVAGVTRCADFPVANPVQGHVWAFDAFVTRLDPSGSALVYSTYLGGIAFFQTDDTDAALGIAVAGDGSAWVTGYTNSVSQFPIQDALYPTPQGGYDAFVTRLGPDGSLLYSSYLGGPEGDFGYGIAVDAGGNPYVAGLAGGSFPLRGPYQSTTDGRDAFVTKLDASGSALLYSTYLGGATGTGGSPPGFDAARAIAVDTAGRAHVAGETRSADFPTRDPIQAAHGGGFNDAFVAVLDSSGADLAFASYLGGAQFDTAAAVAIAPAGQVLVAGATNSLDFPLLGPLQPMPGGVSDGFITRICTVPGTAPGPVGNTVRLVRLPSADLRLTWTDVTGATHYNAYRDLDRSGPFATPFGSTPSGTSGLERPPPSEALVFFRVAAAAECAEGPR